jgi:ABC-type uncharacterized transport system permease subunit
MSHRKAVWTFSALAFVVCAALLGAIVDAGRWPVGVYRGAARVLLTVIVPVALVTSGPAMALTGRLAPAFAAQAIAVN